MSRPRVLFVLPDVPLPADTGLHLRMIGNIWVAKELGWEVHVAILSAEDRGDVSSGLAETTALVGAVHYLGPRKPQEDFTKTQKAALKAKFAVGGLTTVGVSAYPFSMRYDAVGGAAKAAKIAAKVGADAVVIPSFLVHWMHQIRQASRCVVIVDAIDVLTDLTRRLRDAAPRTSPITRLSRNVNYWASRSQERKYLPQADEIWATSEAEAERLRGLAPATNVVVVPNVVADRGVSPQSAAEPDAIGFIGTYSSEPNLVAAHSLVHEIFPRVRQVVPQATLHLAGANLPEEIAREFSAFPGTIVAGRVEDSAEFVAGCQVLALPIRVRGGVPLKLIEAFAIGRPVVATPQLVAGLDLRDGVDLLVRDSPEAFADALIDLLGSGGLCESLAAHGRSSYVESFSEESLLRGVDANSVLSRRGEGMQ